MLGRQLGTPPLCGTCPWKCVVSARRSSNSIHASLQSGPFGGECFKRSSLTFREFGGLLFVCLFVFVRFGWERKDEGNGLEGKLCGVRVVVSHGGSIGRARAMLLLLIRSSQIAPSPNWENLSMTRGAELPFGERKLHYSVELPSPVLECGIWICGKCRK